MNDDQVLDRLRELPPDLTEPVDRMGHIEERVRRQRRRTAARAAVAASAGVVAVVALAVALGGGQEETRNAVDPAAPTTSRQAAPLVPGATRVVELSDPVTTFGTGTQTVELGTRPPGANALWTQLACISAGRIEWPDGASMRCDDADAQEPEETPNGSYQLDLAPDQTSIEIRAGADVSWKLVTTYVRTEPTDWATNANGDTYGVPKDDGAPDLVAVEATNGRTGYSYAKELDGYQPTSPADALRWQEEHGDESRSIPVYESDGETVIGDFVIQPGSGGPALKDP